MWRKLAGLVVVLSLLVGCSGQDERGEVMYKRLADIPAEKLAALSEKSYFFGHQSVGRNMLDGLRMVMEENPVVKLNVVEGEDSSLLQPGVFLHANLGKNREPGTKMDAYVNAMEGGLGGKVDTAFLKFCYVDMERSGDPAQLFAQYKSEVNALQVKYPDTTFVHFTLPIKTVPTGLKVTIKNLIGKEVPQQLDNVKRAEFNELVRAEYKGKEPLFDIAHLESVAASTGEKTTFQQDGKVIEAMAPENTNDGGHLGDEGKRWIAEQLIIFLAGLE